MQGIRTIIIGTLVACALLTSVSPAQAAESKGNSSAESFLAQAEVVWHTQPPYIVDVTTTQSVEEDVPATAHGGRPAHMKMPDITTQGRLSIDGERMDCAFQRIRPTFDQPPFVESLRHTWDGTRYWRLHEPVGPAGWCPERITTTNTLMKQDLCGEPASGLFLFGAQSALQGKNWIELARAAQALELLPDAEPVGSFPCRHLRMRVVGGKADFWVDGNNGYHLRRMTAALDQAVDSSRLSRLVQRLKGESGRVKTQIQLSEVRIEQVDGHFLPVSGVVETQSQAGDGLAVRSTTSAHWTNLRLNPDFAALGAFQPGLPERTPLLDEQQKLPFVWRQGRVQVYLDPALQTQMNENIREIVHEHAAGGVAKTSWLPSALPPLEDPATWPAAEGPDAAGGFSCYDPIGMRDGVLSLYVAARLAGRPVPLTVLLKNDYIGGVVEGSSPQQLLAAARENGLPASICKGLTRRDLQNNPMSLLLHVRATPDSRKFNGYELFLGTRNGQAWLYDVRQAPRLEPYSTLTARWDGSAIALPPAGVDRVAWPRPDWPRRGVTGGLYLVALCTGIRLNRRPRVRVFGSRRYLPRVGLEFIIIVAFAASVGALWHFISADGLFAQPDAVTVTGWPRLGQFLPEVPVEQLKNRISPHGDALLIDARDPQSFAAGHIPGAINISLEATALDRQKAMATISKTARIIVYCSSSTCHIADHMSGRLAADGFSRLEIFRGGWSGWMVWRSQQAQTDATASGQATK